MKNSCGRVYLARCVLPMPSWPVNKTDCSLCRSDRISRIGVSLPKITSSGLVRMVVLRFSACPSKPWRRRGWLVVGLAVPAGASLKRRRGLVGNILLRS